MLHVHNNISLIRPFSLALFQGALPRCDYDKNFGAPQAPQIFLLSISSYETYSVNIWRM